MLISLMSLPLEQDPRVVVACIRACVWARIEERPFCFLPSESERVRTLRSPAVGLMTEARQYGGSPASREEAVGAKVHLREPRHPVHGI